MSAETLSASAGEKMCKQMKKKRGYSTLADKFYTAVSDVGKFHK